LKGTQEEFWVRTSCDFTILPNRKQSFRANLNRRKRRSRSHGKLNVTSFFCSLTQRLPCSERTTAPPPRYLRTARLLLLKNQSLSPVAAHPDITVSAMAPIAGYPNRMSAWSYDPSSVGPYPAPMPPVVPWNPNVTRSWRSDNDLLRRWRRCLTHHYIRRRGRRSLGNRRRRGWSCYNLSRGSGRRRALYVNRAGATGKRSNRKRCQYRRRNLKLFHKADELDGQFCNLLHLLTSW
jgi:hypothetical protein